MRKVVALITYLTAMVDETRKVAALCCIHHVVQINAKQVGRPDALQKKTKIS